MERLALILAEMLRSALDWEQEKGQPAQITSESDLTDSQKGDIPLIPPVIIKVGEKDDPVKASQK